MTQESEKDWVRVSALRAACALHAGEFDKDINVSSIRRHVIETAKQFEKHLRREKD